MLRTKYRTTQVPHSTKYQGMAVDRVYHLRPKHRIHQSREKKTSNMEMAQHRDIKNNVSNSEVAFKDRK